jgi:quercetin dioxygenase-like cupin family protein
VGAVSSVEVIARDGVDPVELPGGSWSRMLVTAARAGDNRSSLGVSCFTPGTVLTAVSHDVEEVAFVVSGSGELRLDDGVAPFAAGDALFIPPKTWHAVANTGTDDVIMVFGFPHPDYPPTARR